MKKQYRSFDEIDDRLRILKLRRQINMESMKLHLNHTKQSLYPSNLIDTFKHFFRNTLISLVAAKLFKKRRSSV